MATVEIRDTRAQPAASPHPTGISTSSPRRASSEAPRPPWLRELADLCALGFVALASPVLKRMADHRYSLPRAQRFADAAGFQIRGAHYYEPTYREADLPPVTDIERPVGGLDLNEAAQFALLDRCVFAGELRAIPLDSSAPGGFRYNNRWYGCGDAEMLYNIVRLERPRRILEIGSGQSTLMARLAIEANRRDDPAWDCEQICVEPYEAPWLEALGVTVLRERVEKLDRAVIDRLEPGDILFIDSSHVIRPWGDVLCEFQELVPRVAPGVLVHVHDIFTPRDYPEAWLRQQRRLWNEQYLLEAFLAFNTAFEVVCATNWLKHNHFERLARACPILGDHPNAEPGAFWFRRKPA